MVDFLHREKTGFLKNHPKCFSGERPFIRTGGMILGFWGFLFDFGTNHNY